MRLILNPVIQFTTMVTWLNFKFSKKFLKDELSLYRAYGAMAGLHAYRRGSVWRFGYESVPTEMAESSTEIQKPEKAPRTVYTPVHKKQLVRSLPGG
jgi:hypothetical protein